MTSSTHDAGLKGNNFKRTLHPESFIAVVVLFSELEMGASGATPSPGPEGREKPGLDRLNCALFYPMIKYTGT